MLASLLPVIAAIVGLLAQMLAFYQQTSKQEEHQPGT